MFHVVESYYDIRLQIVINQFVMFPFLTSGLYLINLIWCSTSGTVPEAYMTNIQTLLVMHAVLRDTGKKRHPWPVTRCVHGENAVQNSFASCQQAISWTRHSVIICWNSYVSLHLIKYINLSDSCGTSYVCCLHKSFWEVSTQTRTP